jgi:hypothetical protein
MHLYFSYQSGANGGVIVVKKKHKDPGVKKIITPAKKTCMH